MLVSRLSFEDLLLFLYVLIRNKIILERMNTMTNTKNSFTRFAAAAKDCFYVNSFRADLVQCDRALKMDGEMHVEAECWMNILDALDDNDIKMYVDNEYRPGLLNPFHKW